MSSVLFWMQSLKISIRYQTLSDQLDNTSEKKYQTLDTVFDQIQGN